LEELLHASGGSFHEVPEGKHINGLRDYCQEKKLKPRPESGRNWLICAEFAQELPPTRLARLWRSGCMRARGSCAGCEKSATTSSHPSTCRDAMPPPPPQVHVSSRIRPPLILHAEKRGGSCWPEKVLHRCFTLASMPQLGSTFRYQKLVCFIRAQRSPRLPPLLGT